MKTTKHVVTLVLALLATCGHAADIVPAALLNFTERGTETKGLGAKVTDLLFAELSTLENLWLVDREDLQKTLSEQELSASGMVNAADVVKIGGLTGAKVLVSGSIFEVDKNIHIVAKIIGTETSRTFGFSAKTDSVAGLPAQVAVLAQEISKKIDEKSNTLLAPEIKQEDRVAGIRVKIGNAKLPSASIVITERHVSAPTVDPAVETEFTKLYIDAGGNVVTQDSTIAISGEAFSEFAIRRGNFVSVTARVEIKVLDRASGDVLATDREIATEVGLSEQIAAKQALQNASAKIAERMIPKLAR